MYQGQTALHIRLVGPERSANVTMRHTVNAAQTLRYRYRQARLLQYARSRISLWMSKVSKLEALYWVQSDIPSFPSE